MEPDTNARLGPGQLEEAGPPASGPTGVKRDACSAELLGVGATEFESVTSTMST